MLLDAVCSAAKPLLLDDLLLEPHDPIVVAYLDRCRALRRPNPGGPSGDIWKLDHEVYALRNNIDRRSLPATHDDDQLIDAYPGLRDLTPRHLDKLALLGFDFPSTGPVTHDVNNSLAFTSSADASVSCLTTRSVMYLGHHCRRTRGLEHIHFANIHFGTGHARLREENDALLKDIHEMPKDPPRRLSALVAI